MCRDLHVRVVTAYHEGPASERRQLAAVAVGYVALAVAAQLSRRLLGVELVLAAGAVLALGLLWGPVVAWGAAAGAVVVDVLTGSLGPATGLSVLVPLLIVWLGRTLWTGVGGPTTADGGPAPLGVASIGAFAFVAVTVSLFAAALEATVADLLGAAPFGVVVVDAGLDLLASTLLAGGLVRFGLPPVASRYSLSVASDESIADGGSRSIADASDESIPDGGGESMAAGTGTSPASGVRTSLATRAGRWLPDWDAPSATSVSSGWRPRARVALALGVALGWCVAGFWASLVFQGAELHRTPLLVSRFPSFVGPVFELAGPGGRTAVLLIGVTAVGVSAWLLRDAGTDPA